MGRKDEVISTKVFCELTETRKYLLCKTTCITDTEMDDDILKFNYITFWRYSFHALCTNCNLNTPVCLLAYLNHPWCQYIIMSQNMLMAGWSRTKRPGLSDDLSDMCWEISSSDLIWNPDSSKRFSMFPHFFPANTRLKYATLASLFSQIILLHIVLVVQSTVKYTTNAQFWVHTNLHSYIN